MLGEIFNKYVELNGQYVKFINDIVNNNFENYSEEEIMSRLVDGKKNFEDLMSEINECNNDEEDGLFLKDVKYSVVDGLFLTIDLYNFYNSKELERFKKIAEKATKLFKAKICGVDILIDDLKTPEYSIVEINEDTIYFISDDTLYKYTYGKNIIPLIKNTEWKFNYNNQLFIFN